MIERNGESVLQVLVGKKLESVCFVLDYITFQFGDFTIAALAKPRLIKNGEWHFDSQPGYRDALCGEIEQSVISISEKTERIEIILSSNTTISVPLDASFPRGPEMATLSGKGRFIAAWLRPAPEG